MLMGSSENPYKKLLEDDSSEDKQQEEYLVTLLMALIDRYDSEYDHMISEDNQESMNSPIKEYTTFFEIQKDKPFEVDYASTIEKILIEFPQLKDRQEENPSFLIEVLIDFKKDGGFDDIDEDKFSLYDGDIKIGYLQCYTMGNVYLNKESDIRKYIFDKYANKYYTSYGDYISVENILKNLNEDYIENNYEDLLDSDIFSASDIKILNELDCKSNIIDNLGSNSYLEFNEVEFSAYADRLEKDFADFSIYVEADDFFPIFREYLLSNTSLLGFRSEDNSVWEEEE